MFRWFEFQDKCSAELSITIGSGEGFRLCQWLTLIQFER